MARPDPPVVGIVALTPQGAALGRRLHESMPGAELWLPEAFGPEYPEARAFRSLKDVFAGAFRNACPLICIMAAGIVVRHVAPLLRGKDRDPAVVVMDEAGRFAISLLSGHLGGANDLARSLAALLGATPVITTATDVQGLPALDALAARLGWGLENLPAVKDIHLALLKGQKVRLVDPGGCLGRELPGQEDYFQSQPESPETLARPGPAVYVGCREYPWPPGWLRLRPRNLAAGVGCNKGTPAAEILALMTDVFARFRLSLRSLHCLATIAAKKSEPGLVAAAQHLGVTLVWYTAEELQEVPVPNPSAMVQRHMGVASVCEAAALKAAGGKTLLIPKQKTPNVTLAVAQVGWPWSV